MLILRLVSGSRLDAAQRSSKLLLDDASRDAEATRRESQVEARELAVKLRAELESELRERRDEVVKIEERVLAKEEDIGAVIVWRHGPLWTVWAAKAGPRW